MKHGALCDYTGHMPVEWTLFQTHPQYLDLVEGESGAKSYVHPNESFTRRDIFM
jgi:hypothetical protein